MQSILITGANRGIGLELTLLFLSRGWLVFAACRNPKTATALQGCASPNLRILELDVTSDNSVSNLTTQLGSQTLDVLINNAGIMSKDPESVQSIDFSHWLQVLSVNTIGPMRVLSSVLNNLKRSKRPRVITISSQMGAFNLEMGSGHIPYSSSKSAVSKAMLMASKELREDGIIVCPVHPGWVRTDMGGPHASISPEESAAGIFSLIDGLTLNESGRFWSWDGKEHVW
jgi:NAD(P)-dependent dehydrogenase (short-subunit alcohol dehydrogenase family)